jgi:hypothetical protein
MEQSKMQSKLEEIFTRNESDNLRKYLLSAGYIFGDRDKILWEPSFYFKWSKKRKKRQSMLI